ncbi:penicillin-binding protein [Candidatus Roizmanbacteria bacterium]|nr:penicillin-binding protein [Candidatus Roizmanbacteria bacterium]
MGYIFFVLLFFLFRSFQTVGEGTIWTGKLLIKLITIFINEHIRFFSDLISLLKKCVRLLANLLYTLLYAIGEMTLRPFHSLTSRHKAKKMAKSVRFFSFRSFVWGFILALIIISIPSSALLLSKDLPNPAMLTVRQIPLTTKLYDRNGELLYEIFSEQNRTPVKLVQIPQQFIQATLAIEDKNFYIHKGFSPRGIIRAAYATLVKDDLQGGSTITQQLVRSALLTPEISLKRKIKELVLSIWTEQLYGKDEILSMYFNQVPYGGTAWGAEAAAQTYFGKSIRDVTLPEAALLAGLPAAPTRYSPFGSHPELALLRQKEVLREMYEDGYITKDQQEEAERTTLSFRHPDVGIYAPHFVMYVRDILAQHYGVNTMEQGGLRVTTSLDLTIQNSVQTIVSEEVEKLAPLMVTNGAALVTDPSSGQILAMVGSVDYFNLEKDGNVNVTLTPQQPGSAIKVITYVTALSHGFTAATILQDSPIAYAVPGNPTYAPVNYDGRFHGFVPLRYALGNSYNVPAVRTLAKIGIPAMIAQGKQMGITSWNDPSRYGLSLTLGGGEVTMIEMAQVYGTLANSGTFTGLTPILTVTDYRGNVLEDHTTPHGVRAVSEDVVFIISDILADNAARTAAFGSNSSLSIPGSWVAVKTGTSNEKRDNWTIGFTNDFVVTVWVGNMDNSPMHPTLTSGITGATPIWRKITDLMLTKFPSTPPQIPEGVEQVVCRGRNEYFVKDDSRANTCPAIPTVIPSPNVQSH